MSGVAPPMMRRCRPLLGTYVEIGIETEGVDDPATALEAAYCAMTEVQRRMSFHCPDSDLSRINATRPGDALWVHPLTQAVLCLAAELHQASDGRFDCGVGATLRQWGRLPHHAASSVVQGEHGGSIRDVSLHAGGEVRVHDSVCLDFGGIAKGFAVDLAIEALASVGIQNAIVNAGGDLRVLGEQACPVHIRLPRAPSTLFHLGDLSNGAVATSAAYFSPDRHGSLVDPASRRAVRDPRSFTVLAPLCAVADGLTKVLAVGGSLTAACMAAFDARPVVL